MVEAMLYQNRLDEILEGLIETRNVEIENLTSEMQQEEIPQTQSLMELMVSESETSDGESETEGVKQTGQPVQSALTAKEKLPQKKMTQLMLPTMVESAKTKKPSERFTATAKSLPRASRLIPNTMGGIQRNHKRRKYNINTYRVFLDDDDAGFHVR